MRNLKKILALVLALIMSLSLMATAGATDFSDADQITDDYAESVDVLDNLKVFQGYPSGDFQPQGEIKRSEVAVIIYRIATGDVDDSQVSIYKDYNKFSDVTSSHWAAGYINYCANAEYIKGRNAKTFDPEGKVTGYEALAMILRAVGYDKQGEFTGSNWHIQTAATGKQLGVTDKINSDIMLKQPATREMVAEILCKSILVPTVEYTAAFGYRDYTGSNTSDKNESLGYKTFGLEYIEGVVTGNEFADLENEWSAMDAGYSRIARFDGEKDITLRVKSHFGDIGESRRAYIVPVDSRNKSEHKMACSQLWPTTDNVVSASGASTSPSALAGAENIRLVDGTTEYYVNYDKTDIEWKSEWRISYYVEKSSLESAGLLDWMEDRVSANAAIRDPAGATVAAATGYFRAFAPGTEISATDRSIMQSIFYRADLAGTNPIGGGIIRGEVYVGTESLHDISDEISWNQFVTTYIATELVNISGNGYGNYLKVIDNNDDGIVDYVLLTRWTLDEVVGTTSTGNIFYRTMPAGSTANFEENTAEAYKYDEYADYDADVTPAVNDVVIWAAIDGAYYAHIVNPAVATIKNVNFTNTTVTDTADNTYNESDVVNGTLMADQITAMSELVEYTIYKDLFGYLRAYKAPGSRYALLTEMYPTTQLNGSYVRNIPWIAEIMTPADNYPVEQSVLNAYPNGSENVFIDNGTPITGLGVIGDTVGRYNYLQNAIAHLGLNCVTDANDHYSTRNVDSKGDEFFWAVAANQSATNVAKYTKAENGVNLYTASEFAYRNGTQLYYGWHDNDNNDIVSIGDTLYNIVGNAAVATVVTAATDISRNYKGDKLTATEWARYGINVETVPLQPVYAVDYIRLAVENVTAGMRQYTIADYTASKVDATSNTDFYIVGADNGIRHITGNAAVPAIAAEDIKAIYTVATNTNANSATFDYWVAEVIVIELTSDVTTFDAIDMTYTNTQQTTGEIKQVSALDSEADAVIQTLYPTGYDWGNRLTGANVGGFWGRSDSKPLNDGIQGYLHRIGPKTETAKPNETNNWVSYNKNGIYAGVVVDLNGVYTPGGYIAVNMEDNHDGTSSSANTTHDTTVSTWFGGKAVPVYSISSNGVATELRVIDGRSPNSQLSAGDHIIWVYNVDKTEVAYIVNVTYYANHDTTPTVDAGWLADEFENIILEQGDQGSAPVTTFFGIGDNAKLSDIRENVPKDQDPYIDQVNPDNSVEPNSYIALNYSDALEGWLNGDREIFVLASDYTNKAIQTVSVQKMIWDAGTAQPARGWVTVPSTIDISRRYATIDIDPETDMDPAENVMWRVTVTTTTDGAVNAAQNYLFVRYASVNPAALSTYVPNLPIGGGIGVTDNNINLTLSTQADIDTFLKSFYATNNGSIEWTFVDGWKNQQNVYADRYSHLTGKFYRDVNGTEEVDLGLGYVMNFDVITATVMNEDGTTSPEQVYTWVNTTKIPDGTNYIVVVPDPKDPNTKNVAEIVITEDAGKAGQYTIVVTMLNGARPYLHQVQTNPALRAAVANGWIVVKEWEQNPIGTWTIVIKADPYSQFIVNSDSTGSVTPPTGDEFPSEVTVTIDDTLATAGTDYTYDAETGTLTIDTANLPEGKVIDTVKIGNTTYTGTNGKYILKTETSDPADVVVTLKEEGTEPTEPAVTVEAWKVGADAAPVEGTLVKAEDGSYTLTAPDGYTIENVEPTTGVTVAADKKTATVAKPTADVKLTVTLKKVDEPTTPSENENNTDLVVAAKTGNTYELSKYGDAAVTDEEAAAAIAKLEELDPSAVKVTGNTVEITKDGKTTYAAISNSPGESKADPAKLYQVKYNGEVWAYLPTNGVVKSLDSKYVIKKPTTGYTGYYTGTPAADGNVAVVDESSSPKVNGADVEYVDAVCLQGVYSSAKVASVKVGSNTTAENVSSAGDGNFYLYIEEGLSATINSTADLTAGTTYQLYVNDQKVGEGKTADATKAISFDIANLTGNADGVVKVAIVSTSSLYTVKINGDDLGAFATGAKIDLTKYQVTASDKLVKRSEIAAASNSATKVTAATTANNYPHYVVKSSDQEGSTKVIDLCTATAVTVDNGLDYIATLDGVNKSITSDGNAMYIAREATLTFGCTSSQYVTITEANTDEPREWLKPATSTGTTVTSQAVGDKAITVAQLTSITRITDIALATTSWKSGGTVTIGTLDSGALDSGWGNSNSWATGTPVIRVYNDAEKKNPVNGTLARGNTYTVEISGIVVADSSTLRDMTLGKNADITVDSATGTLVTGDVPTLAQAADGTYTITMTITPPSSWT